MLGEARSPRPTEGCTCLSLTFTCVDRPVELRSTVACRSTASLESFLTPTFLTVPFPVQGIFSNMDHRTKNTCWNKQDFHAEVTAVIDRRWSTIPLAMKGTKKQVV